ncbi:hypothetical protein [Dyella amyloliquefaciens]|uniref:hypothetical protein n=1 Tax=Dyella amyloliquefaciens TaxID=1770545 RepID=UPI0013EE4121|nr:hypothetical protein [Dyella amyloliquefaciens]
MFDRVFENAVDIHGNKLRLAVKDGRFSEKGPELVKRSHATEASSVAPFSRSP